MADRGEKDGAVAHELDLTGAADPESVRTALRDHAGQVRRAGHGHGHPGLDSVRHAVHRGHRIEVRTTYEITVDDQPFDAAVSVDNGGRVHYHGLPTRDFASVITLVEKAIDLFPDDFARDVGPDHEHEGQSHEHDHGDHHVHADGPDGHGGGQ